MQKGHIQSVPLHVVAQQQHHNNIFLWAASLAASY